MKPFLAFRKCLGLSTALVALLPLTARAQLTPSPDWTASTPNVSATAFALDAGDSAYVAGDGAGPTMTLTRVGPAGAQLWQRSFDNNAGMFCRSTWVAVDSAGNAIVTGTIVDSLNRPGGLVVLKYDAAGTLLWQDVIPSPNGTASRAVADAAGNIYVAGLLDNPLAANPVLLKYSPSGSRQLMQTFAYPGYRPDSVAIAPGGNLIVSGVTSGGMFGIAFTPAGTQTWFTFVGGVSSASTVLVGGGGELYLVGGGATQTTASGYLVVKYSAAFTELWRTSVPARGLARSAALDQVGNILVTGYTDTNTCTPGLFCAQVALNDWLTIKLDPNGALLWTRSYDRPPGGMSTASDDPRALALGSDGAAYITGYATSPLFYLGAYYGMPSTLTIKYGPDGTLLWTANEPSPSLVPYTSMAGLGVKVTADGGVLALGALPQTVFRYGQSGLPNQPPVARASAVPSAGAAPLGVTFSAAGSLDPDGRIASYAWDFGDGQTSTASNPSHTYAAGSYTATLIVTDTLGSASAPAPVTVTASAPAPARPTSLTLAKASLTGGTGTTATVTVSSAAGVTVVLSSSNTGAARVPATVVVPAGSTSATFKVSTLKVTRDTTVTLKATANGAAATASLTVRR